MRNLQEVYKASLKRLQHFFQIYFTSGNTALRPREGLKILKIHWSIHTTAVPDCKDASCCMYNAKTLGRTMSAWTITWFMLGSCSTAGRKGQQGEKATHCFHVLTGNTRDRPTCPAVPVVSLPSRAQHPRFVMISASPSKLPTILPRLPGETCCN